MSWTTTAPGGAAAASSADRDPTSGCTIAFSVVERVAVGEHDSRQRGAIQLTVRADDARPESRDDGGKARRARLDDLSSDDVGVDDDRAMLAQQGRRPCSCPIRHRRSAPTFTSERGPL